MSSSKSVPHIIIENWMQAKWCVRSNQNLYRNKQIIEEEERFKKNDFNLSMNY